MRRRIQPTFWGRVPTVFKKAGKNLATYGSAGCALSCRHGRARDEARRKAELCRRAAAISIESDSTADRALVDLARRFEREADSLERCNSR